jgi:hypothetical protein
MKTFSENIIVALQNPTLSVLVAEGVTPYDDKQGSGPPKPSCEASCQMLHGTEMVIVMS